MPARRKSENFPVEAGNFRMIMTVGFYEDGRPGEVFVSGTKAGTELDSIARDAAVLLSLAMQHGVPLETVAHAVTRDSSGAPSSVMGALVDRLHSREKRDATQEDR
jgi:hypothetical protein